MRVINALELAGIAAFIVMVYHYAKHEIKSQRALRKMQREWDEEKSRKEGKSSVDRAYNNYSGYENILYGDGARQRLLKGVDAVSNAVKVTAGPMGKTAILASKFGIGITKDGVTVAKFIEVTDPIEAIGVGLTQEVAITTLRNAGDGTTKAVVMMQAMMHSCIAWLNVLAKPKPLEIKRGMDAVVDSVVKFLKDNSKDVGTDLKLLRQVALISANGDEAIADLIYNAYVKIGKDGRVQVEESNGTETYSKETNGFEFNRGYLNANFINQPEKAKVFYQAPVILVADHPITKFDHLVKVMEHCHNNKLSLVIVAPDISGEALPALVVNKTSKVCLSVAIKAPFSGEAQRDFLYDLCAVTGATLIEEGKGSFSNQSALHSLGQIKSINVTSDLTTITHDREYGKHESWEGLAADDKLYSEHIDSLNSEIEEADSEPKKEYLRQRIARIKGNISVLYVGGITEVAMKEKKDRVDDAKQAVQCAIAEGVVPGGATMYLRAIEEFNKLEQGDTDENFNAGVDIVREALKAPFNQLCENADVEISAEDMVEISAGRKMYDFKNFKLIDVEGTDIIDPAKVERICIENSTSMVVTFIQTEVVSFNRAN